MRVCVSAKIKIPTTPEIVLTVNAYRKALQFCVNYAWEHKLKNKITLQCAVYRQLKKTGLQAQLIICCCRQAIEMIKRAKTKPVIKHASIRYNFPRSASLRDDVLSISTIKGRQKFSINIPDCYKKYFTWGRPKESLLKIDRKGKAFFIFTFAKEVEARDTSSQTRVLGIDLGVKRLAVLSTGEHIHGRKHRGVKRQYDYLRRKLQCKGTRSAKRLLKRVSGREKRFVRWANHNVSKRIVKGFEGRVICLENLKGIKQQQRGRKMNRMLRRWSYFQLQKFITYKAAMRGIVVELVNPAHTSQLCHKCGRLGTRSKGSFSCLHCGLTSYSADLNAARNIASPKLGERQAAITQPHDWTNEAKADFPGIAVDVMVKTH